MSNKPTVLVTGGAGYIGSHAVLALRDAGWPVVVVDNLTTGFRFAIPADVPLVEADIADQTAVEAAMRAHDVKAVMHFAGSIVVPESVENPLKYYQNNTVNSRALIESAVRCGVPHLIFSSTAATYGMPDVSPISESCPQRPINPYGMSKLMTCLETSLPLIPSTSAHCAISTSQARMHLHVRASLPQAQPTLSRLLLKRLLASAAM